MTASLNDFCPNAKMRIIGPMTTRMAEPAQNMTFGVRKGAEVQRIDVAFDHLDLTEYQNFVSGPISPRAGSSECRIVEWTPPGEPSPRYFRMMPGSLRIRGNTVLDWNIQMTLEAMNGISVE